MFDTFLSRLAVATWIDRRRDLVLLYGLLLISGSAFLVYLVPLLPVRMTPFAAVLG